MPTKSENTTKWRKQIGDCIAASLEYDIQPKNRLSKRLIAAIEADCHRTKVLKVSYQYIDVKREYDNGNIEGQRKSKTFILHRPHLLTFCREENDFVIYLGEIEVLRVEVSPRFIYCKSGSEHHRRQYRIPTHGSTDNSTKEVLVIMPIKEQYAHHYKPSI